MAYLPMVNSGSWCAGNAVVLDRPGSEAIIRRVDTEAKLVQLWDGGYQDQGVSVAISEDGSVRWLCRWVWARPRRTRAAQRGCECSGATQLGGSGRSKAVFTAGSCPVGALLGRTQR
jgi:hypothetical protein